MLPYNPNVARVTGPWEVSIGIEFLLKRSLCLDLAMTAAGSVASGDTAPDSDGN